MKKRINGAKRWLQQHWRRAGLIALGAVIVLTIGVQCFYPGNTLVPFVNVDGQDIGGKTKEEAIRLLDTAYANQTVAIFAGDVDEAIDTPQLETIGLTVSNAKRINEWSYPWYIRIIPSSLAWWGHAADVSEPAYQSKSSTVLSYVAETFGEECRIDPKNPSAVATEEKITITNGVNGGTCDIDEVAQLLGGIKPQLGKTTEVRPDVTPITPTIATEDVETLVRNIESRMTSGVTVKAGEQSAQLAAPTVRSWLVFSAKDDALRVSIDTERAGEMLRETLGKHVALQAGVTRVKTHDFAEVSRQDGASGRALNVELTAQHIVQYLLHENDDVTAGTRVVPPRVEYTRTYSSTDAGLSALIRHYAEDKSGVYGVSLIELSGNRRRAGYNEERKFTTASTYKVYVAYAVLKRVEAGELSWGTEIAGGRNTEKCFDDMIVLSDNPCAEAFVKRIGYTPLHRDVIALGMKGTSFIDMESYKTTAADLSSFMAMLEMQQLPVSREGQERLLGALRRNIYRQGIPAGASGAVADKVGFLEGLLHDTAIVSSSNGTYVLTILTDKSSWANIAELTRQIEQIR